VLSEPRLREAIEADRIGMVGYSSGGYTTLTTIGGRPDYGLWGVHCQAHPEDDELCPPDGSWVPPRITRPDWPLPPPETRIKAAVVMAPAGILFDAQGLSGVTVPVRIYRAENDRLVLLIEGTSIEGEAVRKTVAVQLAAPGEGRKRLAEAGLTVSAFGSQVRIAAVRFGSRAKKSGFEQGFRVAAIRVPTERPSEHWVYIPALALVALVWFLQHARLRSARRTGA